MGRYVRVAGTYGATLVRDRPGRAYRYMHILKASVILFRDEIKTNYLMLRNS